ncbi:hypothetical protein LV457_02865 [Mycobacterium sp. MYCO198283]|uniref:hypothetical protein n=1 Tax=Mycobacterium sp. MYCO198283 TaxID=2883505 RepID=UPI001E3BD7E6|nr:hypothetical protein [Mycobacterium sp. MYCO198283]MCG5431231.1 hypothetical protein [Mycobacterium sp. MYCO198283]
MPGTIQVTKTGPRTYSPLAGQVVRGGRLVEFGAGGRIREAQAGTLKYAGVALTDAIAPEDVNTQATTDSTGRPVLNTAILPTTVACAYGGDEVPVIYAANANQGDLLVAAANGTVTPAGATPDARTIVGRCTQPGGVTVSTNPRGLARLAI